MEGGILAKLKLEHPEAFKELLTIFEKLGSQELMSRCKKVITQNVNESLHSKLWRHCLKFKKHSKMRYLFCARHVLLVQNFGHYSASLDNVLGTMTKSMQKSLKDDDKVSIRVSERKHVLKEGGKKNYRVKKRCQTKDKSYEPGCEPI